MVKWIPLESGVEVMASLAQSLSFPLDQATFHDVYGTDPDLLAMVPGPHRAVLLLFPTGDKMDEVTFSKGEVLEGSDEVLWIKQLIGNACGTMGLVHSLANSGVPLPSSTPFAQFVAQARTLSSEDRARLLEKTELFEEAHESASGAGQSLLREEDHDTSLHFTTFVLATLSDGKTHMVELDGRRKGPIDHGPSDNILLDAATYIKTTHMVVDPSDSYNIMCLGGPAEEDF